MALGNARSRLKPFVPPKLHITPMMDMFTIILIFLLFSFSNEPQNIKIDKSLELPTSNASLSYKDNIKLVLSQNNLQVENQIVATIKNDTIIGLSADHPETSELYKLLKHYRREADRLKKDDNEKKQILFMCDRRLPFKTIKCIINTAARAGYPNFQFAVLKK